jgi:hypothetical protein
VIARFQAELFVAIVELPHGGGIELFRGIRVYTLCVAWCPGIQETQEELRVDVVMRGYRSLVGSHLPEQERLQEAPH